MPSAEELKAEGNKAFSAKEYKKAAKIYRDAIKLDSKNPILYSNRAQCFLMLEDYDRALKDANSGINLTSEPKMLIKLYFRKGTSLLKLNEIKKAQYCFNRVLEYEPTNAAAKKEIASIEQSKRDIKEISSIDKVIPIEEVDFLPNEFKKLIETKPLEVEKQPQTEPTMSKEAADEIDQLFGHKKSKIDPVRIEPVPPTKEERLGPMAALTGLKNLPVDQKVAAYKFVLNMTKEDYASTFEETGVDVEFLEFLLEAGEYSMNHQIVDNWQDVFLETLTTLSSFKRFSLSILLCNQDLIERILENIKQTSSDSTYKNYSELLQGI